MPGSEHVAPPAMHDLEAEVMAEVWRHGGEVSVREVMNGINGRAERERAYTTFMTILRRLTTKGLLTRRRNGKADFYRARLSEDEYRNARAMAEASELVARYGDAALTAFASTMEGLDPERRSTLRELARDA